MKRILMIMLSGLMSSLAAHAQNIAGKWKEQTDMEFFTKADGSEAHSPAHPPFNGQPQVLEIRADRTFTSTEYMNWIPGVVAVAGVWSLAGDQLTTKTNKINVDYAVNTYTMQLEQDMLILSLSQTRGGRVSRVEKRYKKI